MRLSDIAEVRIGHNFRRELISLVKKECVISTVPVVQPRDVESFTHINIRNLEKADIVNAKEKYFLYQNEILFTNKGDFKAAIWKNNIQTIASSAFYRIKLINEKYYPEYVALYLNSPICKSQLNLRQNTERVSTITINELKQIDIPLPPLEKQKQIVELFSLYEKEVDIFEKLKQSRKKLINSILSQTIKE